MTPRLRGADTRVERRESSGFDHGGLDVAVMADGADESMAAVALNAEILRNDTHPA